MNGVNGVNESTKPFTPFIQQPRGVNARNHSSHKGLKAKPPGAFTLFIVCVFTSRRTWPSADGRAPKQMKSPDGSRHQAGQMRRGVVDLWGERGSSWAFWPTGD